MCHLIRDAEFERRRTSQVLPPSQAPSPRPRRLAGALAAVLVALVAAVALLVPASTPAVPKAQPAQAVQPATAGLDDEVPALASRIRGSGCEHEL